MPWDNKLSCEREVTLAPGQSLPRGSSLSRVHVNRPLVIKLKKPFLYQRLVRVEIQGEVSVSYLLLLITVLSLRIFGEDIVASNKHNYTIFTEGPPASL